MGDFKDPTSTKNFDCSRISMAKSSISPPADEYGPLDDDKNFFVKSVCMNLDVNGNPYIEEFHLEELMLRYQELLKTRE